MISCESIIYIVIPTFNRVEFCIKCIESIFAQTYQNFKIIVVDDNSSDNTFETIRVKFPEVTVIKGTGDLWWAGATNKGCEHALREGAQLLLTLNDDLILCKHYLEQMILAYEKYPNSLIGSLSVTLEDPPRLQYAGTISHNYWTAKTILRRPYLSPYNFDLTGVKETWTLPGRGTLIPKSVFEMIGLFDSEKFPQYSADYDFALRAKYCGFDLLINTDAIIYSRHTATGSGNVGLKESLPTILKSFFTFKSTNYLPKTVKFISRHHPVKLYVPVHLIISTLRTFASYFRARMRQENPK